MQPLTLDEIWATKPIKPVCDFPGQIPEGYSQPEMFFEYAEKVTKWAKHLQKMEEYESLVATFNGLLFSHLCNDTTHFSKLKSGKQNLVIERVKEQHLSKDANIFQLSKEGWKTFIAECDDLAQFLLNAL